jgi:hypothetical protein
MLKRCWEPRSQPRLTGPCNAPSGSVTLHSTPAVPHQTEEEDHCGAVITDNGLPALVGPLYVRRRRGSPRLLEPDPIALPLRREPEGRPNGLEVCPGGLDDHSQVARTEPVLRPAHLAVDAYRWVDRVVAMGDTPPRSL